MESVAIPYDSTTVTAISTATVLPVRQRASQIEQHILQNPITLLQGATGSGKSTIVPEIGLAAGFENIYVLQPRKIAAVSIAKFLQRTLGDEVGYHTGDRCDITLDTRIHFLTQGVAIATNLVDKISDHDLLIIDEAHERTLQMDVIVGLVKKAKDNGRKFHVVLMTATPNFSPIISFFGLDPKQCLFRCPGRLYPITDRLPQQKLFQDIALLIKEGHDTAVFVATKRRIREFVKIAEDLRIDAEIFQLYAGAPIDSRLFDDSSDRTKLIFTTNIAEASITLPISAVIDTGNVMEDHFESGIQTLKERRVTKSERDQRRGRAGRLREGIFIARYNARDLLSEPTPEIQRADVKDIMLRLAAQGVDLETLPLIDPISQENLKQAKVTLKALGCLTAGGEITDYGTQVSQLPVDVRMGCMVTTAQKLGCEDDVITAVSLIQSGSVIEDYAVFRKSRLFPNLRHEAQPLNEVDIFNRIFDQGIPFSVLPEHGLSIKVIKESRVLRDKLLRKIVPRPTVLTSKRKTHKLVKRSIAAGMIDCLYRISPNYVAGSRKKPVYSCGSDARNLNEQASYFTSPLIAGLPMNLHTLKQAQPQRSLTSCVSIDLEDLLDIAPHLIQRVHRPVYFNRSKQFKIKITLQIQDRKMAIDLPLKGVNNIVEAKADYIVTLLVRASKKGIDQSCTEEEALILKEYLSIWHKLRLKYTIDPAWPFSRKFMKSALKKMLSKENTFTHQDYQNIRLSMENLIIDHIDTIYNTVHFQIGGNFYPINDSGHVRELPFVNICEKDLLDLEFSRSLEADTLCEEIQVEEGHDVNLNIKNNGTENNDAQNNNTENTYAEINETESTEAEDKISETIDEQSLVIKLEQSNGEALEFECLQTFKAFALDLSNDFWWKQEYPPTLTQRLLLDNDYEVKILPYRFSYNSNFFRYATLSVDDCKSDVAEMLIEPRWYKSEEAADAARRQAQGYIYAALRRTVNHGE